MEGRSFIEIGLDCWRIELRETSWNSTKASGESWAKIIACNYSVGTFTVAELLKIVLL